MEAYTDILYTVEGGRGTIAINRPKTLNAFTQHTIDEMEDAFRKAEGDRSVGVIVITGTGERAFSAAEHAIFGQNGPRVGSPAGGYMVSQLANIVGHKRAREMWLLCRRYTARQMLEWGLVNAVVPMDKLDEEVEKWANEMLALSPTCLKVVKASFKHHMEHVMGLEMHDLVARIAPGYYESGEQQEGAQAFLEKRPPDFSRWR